MNKEHSSWSWCIRWSLFASYIYSRDSTLVHRARWVNIYLYRGKYKHKEERASLEKHPSPRAVAATWVRIVDAMNEWNSCDLLQCPRWKCEAKCDAQTFSSLTFFVWIKHCASGLADYVCVKSLINWRTNFSLSLAHRALSLSSQSAVRKIAHLSERLFVNRCYQ